MNKNYVTYIMGRLNLIAAYQDKFQYIKNSITKKVYVDSRKKFFKFGIFDVEEKEIENNKFLVGTLTKFRLLEEEEKVNLEIGRIDINQDKNNVVAKSNFVLHVKSGLIAFCPSGNNISEYAFRHVFAEIIKKANDDYFVDADIQIISEERDIFSSLEKFNIIKNINIKLHPSNPSNRDIWKAIDDELHKSNVDTYTTNYTSEEGIIINKDSKILSEIYMAADGYGSAKITGEQDGKKMIASTEKVPFSFDVSKEEDQCKSIEGSILNKFKELWKRMKN